jgi:hypothetical protein
VLVKTFLWTQDDTTEGRDHGAWSGQSLAGAKNGGQTAPPFWFSSPAAAQLGHEIRPEYIVSTGLFLLFGANAMRVIRTLDAR